MSKPIFVLAASPTRRGLAAAMLALAGLLTLWVGFATPPAGVGWQLFLLALGAASLALCRALWVATARRLELTEAGLSDDQGRLLAGLDQIAGVDRGMFAFKPSNGFVVTLKGRAEPAWAPGLWWRFGKRLGVGGTTPPAAGRLMADCLSAALAERAHGGGPVRR